MNTFFARKLRRNPTPAEYKLWWHLQKRRLNGLKFRRQKPIGPFIVDFVCLEVKLIVELDGNSHRKNRDYDQNRTDWLLHHGYRVLRFWNNEVDTNLEGVIATIRRVLPPLSAKQPADISP
jgi:very-short-patch-repair endonuclease